MKLYVMRHGSAEDQAPSGADGDRSLTVAGRERVHRVATLLLESGEAPLHIMTSQLVRAVQTAEIVAIATHLGGRGGTVEVRRELVPGGHQLTLVQALASGQRKRVMLVGHEPDLSSLISQLLGTFDRSFEKTMVVAVHVPSDKDGRARMRFVLDPKGLRFDPDSRSVP